MMGIDIFIVLSSSQAVNTGHLEPIREKIEINAKIFESETYKLLMTDS